MYTVFVLVNTNFSDQLSDDDFLDASVSGGVMTSGSSGGGSSTAIAVPVVLVLLFVFGASAIVMLFFVW